MSTLSLAMIVKNEENVLARCLDSVKDIFDEIVIVDTGSTDSTKEIAKKYTSNIFDFEWVDDFSAARNYSFKQCTCEWVFWLDADDIIKPEDAEKIKKLDLTDKEIIISNYIYFHDEYDNPLSIVPRERILKRSLGLLWKDPIHEIIPVPVDRAYISDINVHHYRENCNDTLDRNLRILKKSIKKDKSPKLLFYLAKEYYDSGMTKEAIRYFIKFLKHETFWWEDRYLGYFKLADCYLREGKEEKFKENIFESLKLEERRAEPYYAMGDYFFSKGQYDRAIHWYEICINLKRPKGLLAAYQPDFYTWKPALQLCVCYNAIGNIEKANEYNEKLLEYRPNDDRGLNNRLILEIGLNKKTDGEGKRLNIGCGGKREEGYVNVDIFEGEGIDEVFSMDNIPYLDNTISAITSEHALEHVGYRQIEKTVREWFRTLQHGGELLLKIPDVDLCCQNLLNATTEHIREWYKFTIYGYQKSLAGEKDEAQYHRWGLNKDETRKLLENVGFVIDYLENYDGYDTPSIGLRAIKPVSNIKIGWIAPINWEAAQTRIRVLNVDRWLHSKGYNSKITNYPEIINENFDVAIVGKYFDEHHYKNIKMLKQYGKTVFCDICEDIISMPWVKEILEISDKVICCSDVLEEKVKDININTLVVEDAYET